MVSQVPGDLDAVLRSVQKLGSFLSWDRTTELFIEAIKPYCVPGNAASAKGRMAIWVRSTKAKRPRILFPEVILLAMRFIAEATARGDSGVLEPEDLFDRLWASGAPEAQLPGFLENKKISFALALQVLGVPLDHDDRAREQERLDREERYRRRHPDVRCLDGLFQDTLIALGEAMAWYGVEDASRSLVDCCFRTLWNRHSSMAWGDRREALQEHLRMELADIDRDPDLGAVRSHGIAVFAALYTRGLAFMGTIRRSASTAVVMRVIDFAPEEAKIVYDQAMDDLRVAATKWFTAIRAMRRDGP